MKNKNGIYIIGVDHGYGNIKTANCCFPTGVESSDTEPTFKNDLLIYQGRYYQIGVGHKEYAAEMIMDEIIDTFVNSVFVYDDKLILTYNYKDGSQTLTLQEIEATLSSDLTGMCPPKKESPSIRMGFPFSLSNNPHFQ